MVWIFPPCSGRPSGSTISTSCSRPPSVRPVATSPIPRTTSPSSARTSTASRWRSAGFGERDLDITAHENVLTVKGQISEPENGVEYLHRGIAQRAFEHRFQLADHVKVVGAKLSQRPARRRAAARGARGDEAAQDRDRRCARTAARDRQQGGLTGQPTAPSGQRVGAAGDRREGARAPSFVLGGPPRACPRVGAPGYSRSP